MRIQEHPTFLHSYCLYYPCVCPLSCAICDGTHDTLCRKEFEQINMCFVHCVSGVMFALAALLGWMIYAHRLWITIDNLNLQIAVIFFFITVSLAVLSTNIFILFVLDLCFINLYFIWWQHWSIYVWYCSKFNVWLFCKSKIN